MTRLLRIPELGMAVALVVGSLHGASAQDPLLTRCGRVVSVSCSSRASGITIVLAAPGRLWNWRIVVPAGYRHRFGRRVEQRFDERFVCLAPAVAERDSSDRVIVLHPRELVVREPQKAPPALGSEVYRTCDTDVEVPTVLREVRTHITTDAARAKVNGSVVLLAVIDRNGSVRDVRVVQSLEPSQDAAAVHSLEQWEFRPATRNGEPVAMAITVQMTFVVQD